MSRKNKFDNIGRKNKKAVDFKKVKPTLFSKRSRRDKQFLNANLNYFFNCIQDFFWNEIDSKVELCTQK